MRALTVAVVVMGVLIVAGVGVIALTVVGRMSGRGSAIESVLLDEPAGTRIVGASLVQDCVAVTLQGGGLADRVAVVDLRSGRVVGRVGLR